MPTQEEAVNTAVALALREEFALSAAPEKTAPGGKRCDITVRENPDAHNFTAVECKHGQGPVNRRDAVKSAQRWLKYPACWNAVALCYPPEIKTAPSVALTPDKLAARADYLMAQVNHNGVQGKWIRGTLGDLARLIKDVDERDMKFVVHTLRDAIELAASFITPQTTKELAEVLQVLYEPGDAGIDRRPALIACLLLTNTVRCITRCCRRRNTTVRFTPARRPPFCWRKSPCRRRGSAWIGAMSTNSRALKFATPPAVPARC